VIKVSACQMPRKSKRSTVPDPKNLKSKYETQDRTISPEKWDKYYGKFSHVGLIGTGQDMSALWVIRKIIVYTMIFLMHRVKHILSPMECSSTCTISVLDIYKF